MKYTPRLPSTNVNVTAVSPLREFFVLFTGLIGAMTGLYLILGLAVDWIAPRLSPELEQKLASPFLHALANADHTSDKIQPVQTLLNSIQNQCAKLPYRFTAYLYDNPQANAVALPGGNIIVFSGILESVTSENELAFVLSHELGHYAHRDHLRGLGRSLVFMTLSVVLFGTDSKVGNVLAQGINLTETSFSRKQETRADEFALDTLNCIYGHVGGATDFFKKLKAAEDSGCQDYLYSTHPQHQQRISHLESYGRLKGYCRKPLRKWPLD